MSPLASRAIAEVHALHAFFAAWFREAAPWPDFAELERALAPDFRMIAPDGMALDRAAVLETIHRARGSRGADFAIAILDPRPVYESDGAVLLEFVEQQYRAGKTTRRLSSALFTPASAAPRGVVWHHLQETWTR